MAIIKIEGVVIGRKNDFDGIAHLVNEGEFKLVDTRDFEAHGFHNDPVNKVYLAIVRAANHIDGKTVVINEERSTKRGRYRAEVSFYSDLKRKD